VLLAALALAGCGVSGSATIDAPVSVYVSLPLTGPRGVDGRDAADGARLALEQAQGKAGSTQVHAVFLDDAKGAAWDPVTVGANARRAVQDSSAAAYIGELDSEPSRASIPITNDAGLVQISPGAGGVDLTRPAAGYPDAPGRYQRSGSPNFARTVPADDVVVDAAVSWASDLGARTAAVSSDGSPFQNLARSEFARAAEERGVQMVDDPKQADVTYDPGTGRLTVVRPSAQTLAVSAELAPERLPGKQFPTQFRDRFHRDPGPYAAYGYEAMELAMQAIAGAGTSASEFRDAVRNGVLGAERDNSVLGIYSITSDGDSTECMIQRYRISGQTQVPDGTPCPPR
jgi:branched-chain amino acid transport system substrate-binding protein